jgi:hypothetical protein
MRQTENLRFRGLEIHLGLVYSLLIVVLQLSLILFSSLYSDDLINYQVVKSFPDFTFGKMLRYGYDEFILSVSAGRCTPLSFYLAAVVFWLSHSVFQYKLLVFAMNLLAVISFIYLLYKLEWQKTIIYFLLAYAVLIQFQISYHDSFTSLNGMYPLAFATSAMSIACFIEVTKSNSIACLIFSICLATVSLFITEVGIISFVVIIFLGIKRIRMHSLAKFHLIPFFIVLLVYALILYNLRQNASSYGGTTIHIAGEAMAKVFFCQLFSVLPLSNFYKLPEIPKLLASQLVDVWVIIFVVIFAVLSFGVFSRKLNVKQPKSQFIRWSLAIGLILLTLPAMILMISIKYQEELRFGYSYLPIYFQNYGAALFLGIVFSRASRIYYPYKKQLHILMAVVYFVAISSTFILNWTMIKSKNTYHSIPALNYYNSIKSGLVTKAVSGSKLVLATDFFYKGSYHYHKIIKNITGKDFDIIEPDFFEPQQVGANELVYKLMYEKNLAEAQLWKWNKQMADFELISSIKYPHSPIPPPLELRTVQKIFY